ncbi:MAG: ATP synthase subunit C [Syntrophaceae bacterium]
MTKGKLAFLSALVFQAGVALFLVPGLIVAADVAQAAQRNDSTGWGYIGAALAVGLACIGSSYAVARIGSAGIGAVTEKPELMGRTLVFLGLAEGIAIYGLIIAVMILNAL